MTTEATNQAESEISAEEAFLRAAGEYEEPKPEDQPVEAQGEPAPEMLQLTPQELEEKIKAAREEAEFQSTQRIRDLSGKVGALQQKIEQLTTAKAAATQSGAEAPTAQQIKDAAASKSKMDALREDFPEWAEIHDEQQARTDAAIAEVKRAAYEAQQRAESTAQELQLTRVLRALDRVLPTWESDIQTPEYGQWLSKQSQQIQQAAMQPVPDPEAATFVIRKYLTDTATARKEQEAAATAKGRRDERLNAAITPTDGKQTIQRRQLTAEEAFVASAKKHGFA